MGKVDKFSTIPETNPHIPHIPETNPHILRMSKYSLWNFSEAYGILGFYQQTQEWIQSRRNAQQNIRQLDEPIMEGDVITMAVKFERSVLT